MHSLEQHQAPQLHLAVPEFIPNIDKDSEKRQEQLANHALVVLRASFLNNKSFLRFCRRERRNPQNEIMRFVRLSHRSDGSASVEVGGNQQMRSHFEIDINLQIEPPEVSIRKPSSGRGTYCYPVKNYEVLLEKMSNLVEKHTWSIIQI